MTNSSYIIVGAEVGGATHFLQADKSISTNKSGTPLDVRFIGEKMVALSRMAPGDRTPDVMEQHKKEVRHALQVRDLDTNTKLSDSEKAAIFGKTTVNIVFEKRDANSDGIDTNERILIIPADGTLGIASDKIARDPTGKGFIPALSYQLDQALALAQMQSVIFDKIAAYGETQPDGWTADIEAALMAHLAAEIGKATTFPVQTGTHGKSVKDEIMSQPLQAFHRAVGIYATNMCR